MRNLCAPDGMSCSRMPVRLRLDCGQRMIQSSHGSGGGIKNIREESTWLFFYVE